MARLAGMAAGAAHELNTPLSTIGLRIRRIGRRYDELVAELATTLSSDQHSLEQGADQVLKLQFFRKLQDEAAALGLQAAPRVRDGRQAVRSTEQNDQQQLTKPKDAAHLDKVPRWPKNGLGRYNQSVCRT